MAEKTIQQAEGRAAREPGPFWAEVLRAASGVARKASYDQEEVIRAVIQELRRLKLRGGLALFTPEGMLEVRGRSLSASVESSLRRLAGIALEGYRFDPQQVGVYRQALEKRGPLFTRDREAVVGQMMPERLRPLLPAVMRLLRNHPVIVAPLILDEAVLGVINVTAPWLTVDDCEMVGALADHVAIALGQAKARAELQASLERERLRNQVVQAVASALDLPQVLKRVLDLAIEATGADAGAIALVEPESDRVSYPFLRGLPESLAQTTSPRGTGLAWRLIETRKPILMHKYAHHPSALPDWVEAGVRAFLGVPLIAGDEAIGALALFIKDKDRSFPDEEVERAQAIATMAAIAVQNARLLDQATQRAEEAQGLIQTARSISASLDQETVLNLIAEKARELLQADGSRVHLHDPESGLLRCVIALDEPAEGLKAMALKPGEGLVGYVMNSGEPLLTNNPAADPRAITVPGTPTEEPEALMLAPLNVRQRTMGVMTVRRVGNRRPFRSSEMDLLIAFAAQAAVALENAHLYGQIASQAQRLEMEVAERTRDLALSEARYRALVETAVGGIFQADPQARFVYVNQAFADMVGYSPEELLGQPLTVCMPKEVGQTVLERFDQRMRGERPAREVYESEFLTRSDQRVPVIAAVSLITDEHDQPQGVSILVFDISERKNLEAALKTERDRLSAILANVGDAVFVMEPEGRIEFVNPAWERLNGFTLAEATGQTPKIIKSGHHTPQFYNDMWGTILSGKPWSGEVVNRRKDGSTYEAVVTVQSVSDVAGRVINLVGIEHDISALKEVDRLKSQFVSDVSHELRTPLTNIRLYLDLLHGTEDRAKAVRYLETLVRESERLANLINDLLSLSRLEAGATPFNPEPIDLDMLLTALVEDRRNLAASRGLQLEIVADPAVPPTDGDRRLLSQVFTNLLTNAMHYTPSGGTIRILTARQSDAQGEWVTATVEDTGMGIAPEEMSLIFARFHRGLAGEASGEPGTGLGLAICSEIAELHLGKITVESQGFNGKGSRFTVWLPYQHQPVAAAPESLTQVGLS
jgi:PAS domain S-box-containing protein